MATAAELIGRYDGSTLALRGGFAHGQALIMDGDDYIGRPTNLAARLCQAARPEELLAVGYPAATLPTWIKVIGIRSVTLARSGPGSSSATAWSGPRSRAARPVASARRSPGDTTHPGGRTRGPDTSRRGRRSGAECGDHRPRAGADHKTTGVR